MNSLKRILTNKIFIGGIVILLQFVLLFKVISDLSGNYGFVYYFLSLVSAVMMLLVSNSNVNPTYRLAWIVIIMIVPPFGAVVYLLFGGKQVPKRLRGNIGEAYPVDTPVFILNDQEKLMETMPKWAGLINYIENTSNFPLYEHTKSTYLDSGEAKFKMMLKDIEEATVFVFLEYFIIKEGVLWDTLFALLKRKVEEGVLVRLIYDDWGCAKFTDLKKQCESIGVEAVAFNPLVPLMAVQMNNRNHRKICVIDERIGYVGGMNIADEYINIGSKYGHWKDTAVRIEGDAVHSLTLMFLQFYAYYSGNKEPFETYCIDHPVSGENLGYVIPFSDSPTDKHDLGLNVHMGMITTARKYIYIQTPYLIIGYELVEALSMAARSGVDVRIVVPHIPDKVIVYQVTKSNYEALLEAGVRIFEYEPGFVHSKTFVVDDEVCTVGTTNMDYRSYYLHFECSIMFLYNDTVAECKKDVLDTINNKCIEISLEMAKKTPVPVKLFRTAAAMFSGLM